MKKQPEKKVTANSRTKAIVLSVKWGDCFRESQEYKFVCNTPKIYPPLSGDKEAYEGLRNYPLYWGNLGITTILVV